MADVNEKAIYKSKYSGNAIDEALSIAQLYDPTNAEVGKVPKKAADGGIEWGKGGISVGIDEIEEDLLIFSYDD